MALILPREVKQSPGIKEGGDSNAFERRLTRYMGNSGFAPQLHGQTKCRKIFPRKGENMKKIMGIFVLLFGILFLVPMTVFAVPALPDAVEVIQPDGAVVKVYIKGDEWNNWVET